jgi:hypothetical protein
MSKKSFVAGLLCAAVVTGANASAAFAGEITGNGKPTGATEHANSICVFSGKNDDPEGTNPELNGPGGVSQSYGQEVKLGIQDPHGLNPGDACNGHTGFFAGGGEE